MASDEELEQAYRNEALRLAGGGDPKDTPAWLEAQAIVDGYGENER